MATLETFKQDMDLVNSFSGSFIDSIKVSRQRVNTILSDFDKALEEERQNKLVLQSIESTISENELNNISVELTGLKTKLIEKHTEYTSLIQNNTQSIQNIAKTIKYKNDKIQDIKTTILNIEQLMSKFKIV
jgi:uncharacterized Fe-S cluster-containing MiaB family protein